MKTLKSVSFRQTSCRKKFMFINKLINIIERFFKVLFDSLINYPTGASPDSMLGNFISPCNTTIREFHQLFIGAD